MVYDLDRHQRKSSRLNGYNYSQEGMYYVTICTRGRKNLLAKIKTNGGVGLASTLAEKAIPTHFPNVEIDEYVIMPDHFHGILVIISENQDNAMRERATARVAGRNW
ncbi:hypothetical protein K8T06_11040 [bacterium]|nr:hypothetical protein [bacterium]